MLVVSILEMVFGLRLSTLIDRLRSMAREGELPVIGRMRLAVILLLILGPTACAAAPVVATIPASRDTTIFQNPPHNSAGGAVGIFAGTNGAGSPRRGIIAFDVAAQVPAGAIITGVELRMYLATAANALGEPLGLHRLSADWGEGTAGSTSTSVSGSGGGFAAGIGDATWNARFHSPTSPTPWSAPGATGDYATLASTITIVSNAVDAPFTWHSSLDMVNDLRSWRDNPMTNFGWALINANEGRSASARAFYSRSAMLNSSGGPLDPAWRPTLTVTYIVPEPATLFLLVIVAAAAMIQRRG
jgi:hypothetical protein